MIVWREEMSIGVDGIDDDHKALFDIINEFDGCNSLKIAEQTAKKLFIYTQSHFKREEELQNVFRYPHRHDHQAEHSRILKELKKLIKSSFIDQTLRDDQIILTLTNLMRDWIVGHVLTHDVKMRQFFQITDPKDLNFLPPSIFRQSIHNEVKG